MKELETTQTPQDSKKFWNTVTPFSKYAAMLVFILMPFIGGWVGYQYAAMNVVDIERAVPVQKEKGNTNVYFDNKVIKGADPSSLRLFDFSKRLIADDSGVYIDGELIEYLDAQTFEIKSVDGLTAVASDKNGDYQLMVSGADGARLFIEPVNTEVSFLLTDESYETLNGILVPIPAGYRWVGISSVQSSTYMLENVQTGKTGTDASPIVMTFPRFWTTKDCELETAGDKVIGCKRNTGTDFYPNFTNGDQIFLEYLNETGIENSEYATDTINYIISENDSQFIVFAMYKQTFFEARFKKEYFNAESVSMFIDRIKAGDS